MTAPDWKQTADLRWRHPLLPLALSGLLAGLAYLVGLGEAALPAIPLLLLLSALLLGHYPGCETALRLAERIAARGRVRRTGTGSWLRPRLPASHAASGGLLLAFGLSGRAPPA